VASHFATYTLVFAASVFLLGLFCSGLGADRSAYRSTALRWRSCCSFHEWSLGDSAKHPELVFEIGSQVVVPDQWIGQPTPESLRQENRSREWRQLLAQLLRHASDEGVVGRLRASSDAGQAGSASQSRVDDSGEAHCTAGNRGHRHKLLKRLGVPDGI